MSTEKQFIIEGEIFSIQSTIEVNSDLELADLKLLKQQMESLEVFETMFFQTMAITRTLDSDKMHALVREVSNKQLHDKYSIAYMNSAMNCHRNYGTIFVQYNKRADIMKEFLKLIHTDMLLNISNFNTIKKFI